MVAGSANLVIEQGSDFVRTITWTDQNNVPINVTGYTAVVKVRPKDGQPLITWTSGVEITITGVSGIFTIAVPKATTINYTWLIANYEMNVTSGGGVGTRLLQGALANSLTL